MIKHHLQLPFRFAGKHGAVSAHYSLNHGHASTGFSALSPRHADWDVKGFPVMDASVSYEGKGYEKVFGWIQIVTVDHFDRGGRKVLIDVIPSTEGTRFPFAAIGSLPRFFDAPANHPRHRWSFRAETFLCKPPLISRKAPVEFVKGFQWGCHIDHDGDVPKPLAIASLPARVWNHRLYLLRRSYPSWHFLRALSH